MQVEGAELPVISSWPSGEGESVMINRANRLLKVEFLTHIQIMDYNQAQDLKVKVTAS